MARIHRGLQLAILLALACLLTPEASAQFRAGIKGGINVMDLAAPSLIITDEAGADAYELSIDKTKVGVHIGFFFQGEFGPLFVQPELLFNSQGVDYKFLDLDDPAGQVEKRDETYQTIDFPLILGFKFGPVRIGGGPVGHLFLNSNSDIDDLFGEDYTANFNTLAWGWQAGVGLDFWKLHIDARYEGNFDDFANHMNYFGQSYAFADSPSRVVVSIGISF